MIKRLVLICILAAFCRSGIAEQIRLDSMKAGSRTYKNVTVLGFNATDVYFTHSKGISNVRLKQLNPELQKMFYYDPEAAAAAEQQQIADNEAFNRQVVEAIESNARQAKVAERRRQMTPQLSLADPLSDKSSIGRPMPELKVERWIGGKPDPRGKFQLVYLWAPWSQASKRFLPEMNALQAKFTRDISFAGLVSEAAADPETDAEVRAEFPTAIDSTEKFISALGVTSVPQVVLADPKGTVRFLGHPAALNEKRLQELVAKFGE